jgi:carbon-monoxide dehydrogenase large subunit
MREFGVGQSLPRSEDLRLVRGTGRYTDDLAPAKAVHMYVLRSPHASARIVEIDVKAAKVSPTVRAVLTGIDATAENLGGFTTMMRRNGPDGQPNFSPLFEIIVREVVRYAGEPVAIVVADSLNAAKDAAELIDITYELQPSVADLASADSADAPAVWSECPGNLCAVERVGDRAAVDEALARAAHVASVTVRISRVAASPIEPRGVLAEWSEADQRFTVHASIQNPHMIRDQLAGVFGLAPHQGRVIALDVGGAFGMKASPHPELALALWAARHLGRPVRWVCERSESFLADCHARDQIAHVELALDDEARFLGLRVDIKANLGAYLSLPGLHCPMGNIGGLSGVYVLPAVHAEIRAYFTHSVPIGAYRGAGRPEASVMIERVIDVAARDLGLNPAELRRRNLIPAEQMPFRTGFVFTYDSGNFPLSQSRIEQASNWGDFEQRRAEAAARGRLRGIGMAHVIEIAAGQADEMGAIEVDMSGAVAVTTGMHNHGQGHETIYRQLIAEFMHVPPDKVTVRDCDTDQIPYGFGTGGSRSAVVASVLIETLAAKVIAKGKRIAATMLSAEPEQIDYREGAVFAARDSNRSATLAEVARVAHQPTQLPPGLEPGLSHRQMTRLSGPTFPNGCHVCEVEIDPATGTLEFVGYWVSEDIGRAINPMIVEGQLHGGVVQGLGQALGEYILYDSDGQLVTGSFMDYQMPRATDVPAINIVHSDTPSSNNPLGVKGCGEGGTVGALPAAMNAINDALGPLGIVNFDMPATPHRLWRAIRDARASNLGGVTA